MKKKIIIPLVVIALLVPGTGMVSYVFAESKKPAVAHVSIEKRRFAAVAGTVQAVTGETIMLTTRPNPSSELMTQYVVDAKAATIKTGGKKPATLSIADISFGDTLYIEGTLNTNSISATTIVKR